MTTTITRDNAGLRDALYALSLAQPVPNAAVLDDLIRQYPTYAPELTEAAIAIALDALVEEDDFVPQADADRSTAVLRAMSRFHNRLHAIKDERAPETKGGVEPPNPFATLDRTALRSLGSRLNTNTVFVLKLRDRQIDEATITDGFRRLVADEMNVPLNVIAAHFRGQNTLAAQAHFKADKKPKAAAKQSFAEAVQAAGLTPEQQSYLMSL